MNTKLAAFVIFVFAVFLLISTFKAYKRNRLPTRIFIMWSFIWSVIGIGALFPSLADKVMQLMNMGVRMNFIMLSSVMILFIIMFYISSHVIHASRKIVKLIQEISILNYKLDKLEKRIEHYQHEKQDACHLSEDN